MILFSKYSGCGNDFVLIDNRKQIISSIPKHFVQAICDRKEGIGADGVILLEDSSKAHFRMRIFNADGSEAEMCGNGIRCLMQFLHELGCKDPSYTIESMKRLHVLTKDDEAISATMGDPLHLKWDLKCTIDETDYKLHYLDTGVPHAVLFVDDLENTPIESLGRKIRFHPLFSPSGANANFAKQIGPQKIAIRTFERGIEAETSACGTGATAVAIAAAISKGIKPPISIVTRSSETLTIQFKLDQNTVTEVTQTGPAKHIFSGTFEKGNLWRKY